eukprot:13158-Heterococcus_DN1.PRE.3
MTPASVRESSADVGSSHSSIGAFLSIARAIATRCFSPPDSISPLSPTTVSNPLGMRAIASVNLAWVRKAAILCTNSELVLAVMSDASLCRNGIAVASGDARVLYRNRNVKTNANSNEYIEKKLTLSAASSTCSHGSDSLP